MIIQENQKRTPTASLPREAAPINILSGTKFGDCQDLGVGLYRNQSVCYGENRFSRQSECVTPQTPDTK